MSSERRSDMAAPTVPDARAHAQRGLDLMCSSEERLLLACSGGPDSVALLAALAPQWGSRLQVAYVHHGLRAAAEREAHHVLAVAECLGLEAHVLRPAQPQTALGQASPRNPASETALRALRLGALTAFARERGVGTVLMAHHGDDALETLALHRARGHRGLRSRAGIPSVRPLGPGLRLARPWLHGPQPPGRPEVAALLDGTELSALEDETNADLTIARNRVRQRLRADGRRHARLTCLRRASVTRLQQVLGQVCEQLARGLGESGPGVVVSRDALAALFSSNLLAAEALRMLGPCLQRRPRLTVRASLIARIRQQERGLLLLPTEDEPVRVEIGRNGWRLPAESLRAGTPAGRLLCALAETPLYL